MVSKIPFQGWQRGIMFKSVSQAISTYVMSCFLLLKGLCQTLSSTVAKFWWSNKPNSRGMHLVGWKKLCLSKKDGGIGFKSFEEFNHALLAKQLWLLNQFPNSLVAHVLKGQYFRNTHPFDAKKPYHPSYGWKRMRTAKDLLLKGSQRIIGSGTQTLAWKDN